ncbi:unnamed protein product [Effrenium voratum]|uniref:Sulfatase N-terminal domain-containing protein n=1 Tax=Effrenium voratum TaxID=2562239 RepID=A0AA36HJW9_9DINO|nr:unnamed protein product [Effrenium voratum]
MRLLLGLFVHGLAIRPSQPHIVFHIIDDWGFHDIGFRSEQMHTPTLNMFHREGVTLEQYYVLPTCSPSRATFLTGRLPLHTGLNSKLTMAPTALPLGETTLPSLLQGEGYRTHAVGKWHLGFYRKEYTPTFRGFESWYGYYGGGQDYFTHKVLIGKKLVFDFHRHPQPFCGPKCAQVEWSAAGKYSTKLFTEEAIRVIRRHRAEHPGEPLFLYQAPKHFLDWEIRNRTRRRHAAMVKSVDEAIGRINAALEYEGMLDNTLVIVTTDNGGAVHECKPNGASNHPLRGGKCSIWEGGTRGTALIKGPQVPRGLVWRGLFHASDWLPTLLEGVLGTVIAPEATKPLDGFNLWHALRTNATSPREDIYYGVADEVVGQHGPALRTAEGWKLVLNGGGGVGDWPEVPARRLGLGKYPALFNLLADPSERFDLSPDEPEVAFALRKRLLHYTRHAAPNLERNTSCGRLQLRRSPNGLWLGPWCT